ncbi:MAG: hypothetical protein FGM58_08275 [Acidimicrobiia bacterium]|nr:hypothetical protein [Acidimicrobiia bacterium]
MADDDNDPFRIVTAEDLSGGDSPPPPPPVIDLGPASGEVDLPHWTEPPTGQIPAVVAGDSSDADRASMTATPRWRGEHDAADHVDLLSDLLNDEPSAPVAERLDPRGRARRAAEGATGAAGRNVPVAVGVGLALAIGALVIFKLGPAPTVVLATVVLGLAGYEYFGAVQRSGFRPATLLGLAAVVGLPLATYWKGEAAIPAIVFLVFLSGIVWFLTGNGTRGRPTANLGITLLGVVWIGVLGSFAGLVLAIPGQGVSILLLAVVATVGNDVGGFFFGRAMGRSPLTTVSPNKTVEGLIGGMASTVFLVFVVAVPFGVGPFGAGKALLLAIALAVVAPLGDLAESLFKRDLGLKDFGSLLPQHGGILDRFDGLLFALPTAYYVARVLSFG